MIVLVLLLNDFLQGIQGVLDLSGCRGVTWAEAQSTFGLRPNRLMNQR
jgi:hypothetical protein